MNTRMADVPENVPLARAIQLRRFNQRSRNPTHGLGEQKHRKRRKRARQNDCPAGVEQSQKIRDQIVWHQRHLIGHEHQNDVGKEDGVPDFAAPSRVAVGGDRRDRQLRQHDRRDQNHRVPEFIEEVRAFQQHRKILREAYFVRDEFQIDFVFDVALAVGCVLKHLPVVGGDFALRHERVRDRQHRRHQEQKGKHGGKHGEHAAGEIALFPSHPSTSFPK